VNESKIRIVLKSKGGRLDQILSANVGDLSRSRLQKLIRERRVKVNGIITTKPSFQLDGDEIIELQIPPKKPTILEPEPIPLDILFENKDLIVINKPAGMVVHPSAGHDTGTLVHAVLAHAPDIQGIGGEQRPGVVHRLDKDTSGLILMAKNDAAYYSLQKQFTERTVNKTYIALVDGVPPTPSGRIEACIGRDPAHRKKMAVVRESKGRAAVSQYKTLEDFPNHTLLEVHPITGRTHQIRLHLAFIGCPVVGDRVYGRKRPSLEIRRHFLHAAKIEIIIPSKREATIFEAPLSEDLEEVLTSLKGDSLKTSWEFISGGEND
jgi:23S rRNA pseudouridine1911/1915/1917 synthase